MSEHPIKSLMGTTMESLKNMIDVNTIVGDPVQSPDGLIIIPISRVSFGFASGGAEYGTSQKQESQENTKMPFGGGAGAGVSLNPVAFIVVGNSQIKLMTVDQGTNILNNLFDFIPKFTETLSKKKNLNNNDEAGQI